MGVVSYDLEKSQAALKDEHKAVAMQNGEVHELARRTLREHEDHAGIETVVETGIDRVPELRKMMLNGLAKVNVEVRGELR